MGKRVIPTAPGWWWAEVDGCEVVLEVWGHANDDVLRAIMPSGIEVDVSDVRLIDGDEPYENDDYSRWPSVEWLAPVATHADVGTLTAERDALAERVARLTDEAERLSGWLLMISGGDSPCFDAEQLQRWAYEAVTLCREVPHG